MPFLPLLNQRQKTILQVLLQNGSLQSSVLHKMLAEQGEAISLVTVKRLMSELASLGMVSVSGAGRSTRYQITNYGRVLYPVDAHAYCAVEPDKRYEAANYNFTLFDSLAPNLFTDAEQGRFSAATESFRDR